MKITFTLGQAVDGQMAKIQETLAKRNEILRRIDDAREDLATIDRRLLQMGVDLNETVKKKRTRRTKEQMAAYRATLSEQG